ncbi:LytR/AlgR family response regulator transcription factor [Enterococcus alishanensis]
MEIDMLSIIICEDDQIQRTELNKIIENYVMIEELNMHVQLSTDNPNEVVRYVEENKIKNGIYFFDIDLQASMNGIELAAEIRKLDGLGKIIFVTTHEEFAPLTFIYKTEALDYILKDDVAHFKNRVIEALNHTNKQYFSENNTQEIFLKIKIGNQIQFIPIKEVMFIETSTNSHRLKLHLENRTIHFYDKIENLDIYPDCLYRTHKSYLVNINNIVLLDKTDRSCTFSNGEKAFVSVRKIKKLEQKLISIGKKV